jgi:hypothetical protein
MRHRSVPGNVGAGDHVLRRYSDEQSTGQSVASPELVGWIDAHGARADFGRESEQLLWILTDLRPTADMDERVTWDFLLDNQRDPRIAARCTPFDRTSGVVNTIASPSSTNHTGITCG